MGVGKRGGEIGVPFYSRSAPWSDTEWRGVMRRVHVPRERMRGLDSSWSLGG